MSLVKEKGLAYSQVYSTIWDQMEVQDYGLDISKESGDIVGVERGGGESRGFDD